MFSEKCVGFNPPCMVFSNRHCTCLRHQCEHTNRSVLTCILSAWPPILMSWKLVNQRGGLFWELFDFAHLPWCQFYRPLQINWLFLTPLSFQPTSVKFHAYPATHSFLCKDQQIDWRDLTLIWREGLGTSVCYVWSVCSQCIQIKGYTTHLCMMVKTL